MNKLYQKLSQANNTINKVLQIGQQVEQQKAQYIEEVTGQPQPIVQDDDSNEPDDFIQKGFDYKNFQNQNIALAQTIEDNSHYIQDYIGNSENPNIYREGGKIDRQYKRYLRTLPKNQRNEDPDFDMYRYWELNGKPKNFKQAKERGMFTWNNEDKSYHAGSVAYDQANDRYEFVKSPNHHSVDMELLQYFNSDEMSNFRRDWKLNMDHNPYLYERRQPGDTNLFQYGGRANILEDGGLTGIPYSLQSKNFINADKYDIANTSSKPITDAYDFGVDYYNSEGFNEKLNNGGAKALSEYTGSQRDPYSWENGSQVMVNDRKLQSQPLEEDLYTISDTNNRPDNAAYIPDQKTIEIGNFSNLDPQYEYFPFNSYNEVFAHEIAHAIEHAIKIVSENPEYGNDERYANIYSIFRKNKQFQEYFKERGLDPETINIQKWDLPHDARPSESYADLMVLRYLLNYLNIFDSRKAGNVATQEHLDQYKKIMNDNGLKISRIFNNFGDEDILQMLNEVAYDENIQDTFRNNSANQYNLAAKGGFVNILKGGGPTYIPDQYAQYVTNPFTYGGIDYAYLPSQYKNEKGVSDMYGKHLDTPYKYVYVRKDPKSGKWMYSEVDRDAANIRAYHQGSTQNSAEEISTWDENAPAASAYDANNPLIQYNIESQLRRDPVYKEIQDRWLSQRLSSYTPYNFLTTMIPTHLVDPMNYLGAAGEYFRGNDNFFLNALSGNNKGMFSLSDNLSNWAEEHPYLSAGANLLGSAVTLKFMPKFVRGVNTASHYRPAVPINEGYYYRQGTGLIQDAIDSGVIRAGQSSFTGGQEFVYPYFYKGLLRYSPKNPAYEEIIVNTGKGNYDWAGLNGGNGLTSKTLTRRSRLNPSRTQQAINRNRTPLVDGQPNIASAADFDAYKPININLFGKRFNIGYLKNPGDWPTGE